MNTLNKQFAVLSLQSDSAKAERAEEIAVVCGVSDTVVVRKAFTTMEVGCGNDINEGPLSDIGKTITTMTSGVHLKKVGPLVPPKPHKKKQHNFPEVPQSISVRKACEPLYSQRLQYLGNCSDAAVGDNDTDNERLDSFPILHRKPLINVIPQHLQHQRELNRHYNYDRSISNKVTLDNPDVLEQQLEALAHHKRQLEKKGLLHQKQHQYAKQQTGRTLDNMSLIPKLSSTSLVSGCSNESSAIIYSNLASTTSSLPSPALHIHQQAPMQSKIYSNVHSNKNDYGDYHHHVVDDYNDDDADAADNDDLNVIPPSPSPVSSSYSELRRASDLFAAQQQQQQNNNTTGENTKPAIATATQELVASATGLVKLKTYMNMNMMAGATTTTSALQHQLDFSSTHYHDYGSFIQRGAGVVTGGSSTYESIYEPINPRPSSNLATTAATSNYVIQQQQYAPYVNVSQHQQQIAHDDPEILTQLCLSSSPTSSVAAGYNISPLMIIPSPLRSTSPPLLAIRQKKTEVEALTGFLVHSMVTGCSGGSGDETGIGTGIKVPALFSSNDVDSYGICFKCKERVLGENSGCTAMGQIYHIACFTCSQCQINLQGKPFYALDGKPYCEYDYLQTLEKCSVCMKPILERILRATGKPYHPQCFTCVVCGNSLDGIPFTVDATNQNYCIADFHKKFAPRCCVCMDPIMPEPGEEETVRVVALDRSFHFECYKCEDCGLLLSSEAEGRGCYPLDDHVLCKCCNAKRVQMLTNRMTTEL